MVARDGIEPPTPAFSGPRAFLPRLRPRDRLERMGSPRPLTLERSQLFVILNNMVARDGIEPWPPSENRQVTDSTKTQKAQKTTKAGLEVHTRYTAKITPTSPLCC